jgi:hypothetical protein
MLSGTRPKGAENKAAMVRDWSYQLSYELAMDSGHQIMYIYLIVVTARERVKISPDVGMT